MMTCRFSKIRLVIGCSMLLASMVHAADADPRDRLLELMEGAYYSAGDGPGGENQPMLDRRVRLAASGLGSHLVYMQINVGDGEATKVYRQRLLAYEIDPESGLVLQHSYAFKQAELFVDAESGSDILSQVTAADIEFNMEPGCEQIWTEQDAGWEGYVDPDKCRIWSDRRQDWRHIEASSKLTVHSLSLAERGFDDAGEQVFGSPPGELTELKRQVAAD